MEQLSLISRVNEVKLSYEPRDLFPEIDVSKKINCPENAVAFFREVWPKGTLRLKESMFAMYCDAAKNLLGFYHVSTGGATATIVDPCDVLRPAILTNAHSIVLCHNHPSGNDRASSADINLTRRLREVGKALGINIDDHIILTGDDSFVSMRSEGLI